MKKLISIIICIVLCLVFSLTSYADDSKSEKNVCYKKPVTLSTRYEFPQVYLNNVVDGDLNTRTSTDTQDLYGDNQWYRVDLCANYTISEVLIGALVPAGGVAKNIAIDVWSNGQWVRVGQKFNIADEDYPLTFYFDEIDCSYISVSTNEPTSEKAASSWFGLSEIQAYHTTNISDSEKKSSFEDVPSGSEGIPTPEKINEYLSKQGSKEDSAVYQYIEPDSLKLPESVYDRTMYSFSDIVYVQKLYADTEKNNSQVNVLEQMVKEDESNKDLFEKAKETVDFRSNGKSTNSNSLFSMKTWILIVGSALVLLALVLGILNFVSISKSRKVPKNKV